METEAERNSRLLALGLKSKNRNIFFAALKRRTT